MKEISPEPEVGVNENVFKEEVLEVEELKQETTVINLGMYACNTAKCGYKTEYLVNLKSHCEDMSHKSSHFDFTDQQIQFQDNTPSPNQLGHVTETESTKDNVPRFKDKSDLRATSFTCETCGEITWHRHQLERHKAIVHGSSPVHKGCEICGKVFTCRDFAEHMLIHDVQGPFYKKCVWCEKHLTTGCFESHALRKHFYGKFLCFKCTFSCNFAKDLIDHINKEHEDKLATCPCCKKDHLIERLENHYRNCIVYKSDNRLNQRVFQVPLLKNLH